MAQQITYTGQLTVIDQSVLNKIVEENNTLKVQVTALKKENTDLSLIVTTHLDNERLLQETIKTNILTIEELKRENAMLKSELAELREHIKKQDEHIERQDIAIEELKKDNTELKKDNAELKKKNIKMKHKVKKLVTQNDVREALSKLNDCDKLANDTFKREYRQYFKLKMREVVPNLGEFVCYPPESNNTEEYDFWLYFCKKYPGSDNEEFRYIYRQINHDRVYYGAHFTINDIDKTTFDSLMETAFPDKYTNDKKTCDGYICFHCSDFSLVYFHLKYIKHVY